MKRILAAGLLACALTAAGTAEVAAQQPPAQPQQNFLPVGTEAPEITLTGATRYGRLAEPVRLSQFRGQTVVLAFFFRARTTG